MGHPEPPHQPWTPQQPGVPGAPQQFNQPISPGLAGQPGQVGAGGVGQPGYGQAPPVGGWQPGSPTPPGPPPPYGAAPSPYGAPAPRKGGGGKVAVIVISVLAGLFLLLDVGGGALLWATGVIGGGSPEDTVRRYYEAAQARDCETMVDLVTEETWRQGGATTRAEAVSQCRDNLSQAGDSFSFTLDDVREVSNFGRTAVVEVTTTVTLPEMPDLGVDVPSGPVTSTTSVTLKKSGRKWLIDGASLFDLGDLGSDLGDFDIPDLDFDLPDLDDLDDWEDSSDPNASEELFHPDELFSAQTWTYEIISGSDTMEGELRLIDVYQHSDCVSAGLTETARLALTSCIGRTEAAYRGTLDGVGVTQQILQFTDYDAASAFVETFGNVYLGEVLAFSDPGGFTSGNYEYAESRIGGAGSFVVATLMVSVSGADDVVAQAQDDAHARQAESENYFLWR